MPPHPLTYFEIQKYYQNEPNFNGVYLRNNLSKIKDGTYIINLDKYESYFDSLNIFQKKWKNIIINTHRTQAFDLIMRGYFCIGFIDFMLKGKILLECTNLFFPNNHKEIIK